MDRGVCLLSPAAPPCKRPRKTSKRACFTLRGHRAARNGPLPASSLKSDEIYQNIGGVTTRRKSLSSRGHLAILKSKNRVFRRQIDFARRREAGLPSSLEPPFQAFEGTPAPCSERGPGLRWQPGRKAEPAFRRALASVLSSVFCPTAPGSALRAS